MQTSYHLINSCLTNVLKSVKKSLGSKYVFPNKEGNAYKSLRKGFGRAKRRKTKSLLIKAMNSDCRGSSVGRAAD